MNRIGQPCIVILLFIFFLSASVSIGHSATITVPADYNSIGEALSSTSDGDEIVVSAGIYREEITISNNLVVYSESGPSETFIIGSGGKWTVLIENEVEFSGFTVTGSESGIIVRSDGLDVLISDCTIGKNSEYGILIDDYSKVYISHNNIVENGFWGIYARASSNIDIFNNIISANEDTGIEFFYANGDIRNNILSRNGYSAIKLSGEYNPNIINNTIARNGYTGIFLLEEALPQINNNIIIDSNYGIYISNAQPEEVEYNDVWNNSNSDYYGIETPDDDISEDPLLVIYNELYEYFEEDFHLSTGSPCINAGDPNLAFNDVDGSRNDIGAYGGQFLIEPIGSGFNPTSEEEWHISSETTEDGCGSCVYKGGKKVGIVPLLFLLAPMLYSLNRRFYR